MTATAPDSAPPVSVIPMVMFRAAEEVLSGLEKCGVVVPASARTPATEMMAGVLYGITTALTADDRNAAITELANTPLPDEATATT